MSISPQEKGFPFPPPPGPEILPPGDGAYTVPYFQEFSAIVTNASRTFLRIHDEALRACPQNAEAMRRDPVIYKSLRLRQYPTAQLSFHIEPDDETDPAQADAAVEVQRIVERMPRRQDFMRQCLEALWYGRYGVQIRYQWVKRNKQNGNADSPNQWLMPTGHTPVHGDSLRFKWDGRVGILVHGTYDGTTEATDVGMAHFLTASEREQFVIHMNEPEAADFFAGEQAGRVNGVGLRDRLYWTWWLKTQTFALLNNYLERFSNGLTIFYYDGSNPKAKVEAEAAAKQQFSNVALLYPRYASGQTNGVERLEVGTASANLLEKLTTGYYDGIIEQTILGQNLTYETAPTGLGSGVAEQHGRTFDQIIKYDAQNLEATEQRDLVDVLYRWNYPGMAPGRLIYEIDTPNATEVLEHAEMLYGMGLPVDAESLYEVTKLARPQQGGDVVSKVAPMQPTAVDSTPAGVPVAGDAGPADPNAAAQQPMPAQPVQQAQAPMQMQRARDLRRAIRKLQRTGKGKVTLVMS